MHRLVGLHIRHHQTPFGLLDQVERLNIPIAQWFLHNEDGIYVQLNDRERKQFLHQRQAMLKLLFAHGSYKINCADPQRTYHPILEHEIKLANALGCTHIVLHAGAASTTEQGIDALARTVNKFCKQQFDLHLVLENVAFTAPSIGSDFTQFRTLLEKIDKPDKLSFCIDTAHSFAAGYDIVKQCDAFINLLATTIGIERIALIHLNDTTAALHSNTDLHAEPGKGLIGIDALRAFALHPQLAHIPLIVELPELSEINERHTIDLVNSWHKE